MQGLNLMNENCFRPIINTMNTTDGQTALSLALKAEAGYMIKMIRRLLTLHGSLTLG